MVFERTGLLLAEALHTLGGSHGRCNGLAGAKGECVGLDRRRLVTSRCEIPRTERVCGLSLSVPLVLSRVFVWNFPTGTGAGWGHVPGVPSILGDVKLVPQNLNDLEQQGESSAAPHDIESNLNSLKGTGN